MKKLLFVLLFAVPAFAQYSSTVLTNSPGDYAHMVPYATVKLCSVSDNAVPCTTQIQTFTDYTLSTQCTLIANAGQTPGPASGAGCNNPGLTDVNGNYTLFAASGQYTLCSYYTSWFCAKIVIGGAGATTLPCPSTVVNGAIGGSNGSGGFNCDNFFTTDFAGNWISQSGQTVGAYSGMLGVIGGGTSPGTAAKYKLAANEFRLLGTTLVTPYYFSFPPTIPTAGQTIGVLAPTTDGNGDTVIRTQWQNSGGCTPTGGQYAVQSNNPDGTCYGDQDFIYKTGNSGALAAQLGGSSGNGSIEIFSDTPPYSSNYFQQDGPSSLSFSNGAVTSGNVFILNHMIGAQYFIDNSAVTPGPGVPTSPIGVYVAAEAEGAIGSGEHAIGGEFLASTGTTTTNTVSNITAVLAGRKRAIGPTHSAHATTAFGVDVEDFGGGDTFSAGVRIENMLNSPVNPTHDYALIYEDGPDYSVPPIFGILADGGIRTIDCASSTSPAACQDTSPGDSTNGAQAGSVVIAASATTVVVNDTAVTANSEIFVQFDETLGSKLSVTCNTGTSESAYYWISARTAGTSFTIKTNVAPVSDPACLSFHIIN